MCIRDRDYLVVFSSPVYGGRIPKVARGRFANFFGNKTPCVITVTYGNRDFDDALLELYDFATANGFDVIGAAALIGRHTYCLLYTSGEWSLGTPAAWSVDAKYK